jgi:hypothetical protein
MLDINMVQADSDAVAFSYRNTLYMARLGGAEHPIAQNEFPLGFTDGGLYTNLEWGRRLLLLSDTGAVLKTIVRRPLKWDYLVMGGSLYFISRGVLMRADGAVVQPLVSLRQLGLRVRSLWIQQIGTLLVLEDRYRVVVLRADGSLFASTLLHGSKYRAENEVNLYAVASASALAFIVAPGQTSGPETVYLLRAGARRAIAVYRRRVQLGGCAHWVSLEWHGRWLLYNDVAGDLAVIDTAGTRRPIELGSAVRRLPGARAPFTAQWGDQPGQPVG